jgi:hypothetical protein
MMSLSPQRLTRLARDLAAYTNQAVQEAITPYDVETRVAIQHAIGMQREAQGIQAKADAPPGRRPFEPDGVYWLRRLGIAGPIALPTLNAKLDAAGLTPEVRIEIKCTAIERQWLAPSVGYRATVAYSLEPLSVQMRGFYRRAGLAEDRTYTPEEVNEALAQSDLLMVHKVALREELHLRRQIRASSQDARAEWLTTLHALQRRLQRL